MGLFDTIRDKAAGLLSGVTEKAGELGIEIPGADALEDLTQSASDTADQASESVDQVSDSVDQASDSVTDSVTESLPDVPTLPGDPPRG